MEKQPKIKKFTMRLPYDLWHFLKTDATNKQSYFAVTLRKLAEQYKSKVEKKISKDIDIM